MYIYVYIYIYMYIYIYYTYTHIHKYIHTYTYGCTSKARKLSTCCGTQCGWLRMCAHQHFSNVGVCRRHNGEEEAAQEAGETLHHTER